LFKTAENVLSIKKRGFQSKKTPKKLGCQNHDKENKKIEKRHEMYFLSYLTGVYTTKK